MKKGFRPLSGLSLFLPYCGHILQEIVNESSFRPLSGLSLFLLALHM